MPDSIQHQKDDAFRNAAGRRRAFPAFLILGLLCVGLALVYVFQGMTPETWDFNMARRIPIQQIAELCRAARRLREVARDAVAGHAQRNGAG